MKLIRDDNDIPEMMERLEKARGTKMIFGVIGSGLGGGKHKGGKLTIVEIATIHEFGAPSVNIPERSFIRKTFDEKGSEIADAVEDFFGQYVMGDIPYDAATKGIGEYVKGIIQTTIRDLSSPALKAITIQLKGSSQPLIDTGQLIDSIEYKVE